jgi:hypothetical protein
MASPDPQFRPFFSSVDFPSVQASTAITLLLNSENHATTYVSIAL